MDNIINEILVRIDNLTVTGIQNSAKVVEIHNLVIKLAEKIKEDKAHELTERIADEA